MRSALRDRLIAPAAECLKPLGYRFAVYELTDRLGLGADFISYTEPGHIAEYYTLAEGRVAGLHVWHSRETGPVPASERWASSRRSAPASIRPSMPSSPPRERKARRRWWTTWLWWSCRAGRSAACWRCPLPLPHFRPGGRHSRDLGGDPGRCLVPRARGGCAGRARGAPAPLHRAPSGPQPEYGRHVRAAFAGGLRTAQFPSCAMCRANGSGATPSTRSMPRSWRRRGPRRRRAENH